MKTAQHTPGPWITDTLGGTTVWPKGGNSLIAQCTGFERAENVSNARLIASAPDLLAALQWVVECFDGDPSDNPDWQYQDQSHAVDRAKLAIAKATGGAE